MHNEELRHRISKAWTILSVYRKELVDKSIPLRLRLQFFQSAVTTTVLHACGSWSMTLERQRALRTAQRRVLRTIMGSSRWPMVDPISGEVTAEDYVA